MEKEEKQLDIMPFMDGRKRRPEPILRPIMIKMVFFTFAVTIAMISIYTEEQWTGYIIYGKEVLEFIVFVCFMAGRRRNGRI